MIGLGWRGADFGERLTLDDSGKPIRTPRGEGPGAGHGPTHSFQITTRDADHPITRGLPSVWLHAVDELYHGQRGPAKEMHVLASAFSASDKGGTGAHEPMLWWIPYGNGRVVTLLLGHVMNGETEAIRCVGFRTLCARSAEWAATGESTLPVPSDFPGPDTLSIADPAAR